MRTLFVTVLLSTCLPAAAFDWPWQEPQIEQEAYCKGLVLGGLSSRTTVGTQRTDLWLAWNHLVRETGIGQLESEPQEYARGRAMLADVADLQLVAQRLDESDGDCGLGWTGWQITGL